MNHRTWQDNADEFAQLDKGEGWPFARLIACSVERGAGGRGRVGVFQSQNPEKVTAHKFAQHAGTSAARVLRFLDAWNKAADAALCPTSETLGPDDVTRITDPEADWSSYYDASAVTSSGGVLLPASTEAPHAWTILVEARKLVRDMEGLAVQCQGVEFDGEVQEALRELVARIRNGADMLSSVIESEPFSDDALHAWIQGGSA